MAFRFAPAPTTTAVAAPAAAPTLELAEAPAVLASPAAKPITYHPTVAPQHRHSAFWVRRPQQVLAWAGHRPAARPAGFLGRHPAERVLLISGAGATVLGLLLNYLAVGSAASTSAVLLSSGHFLLVVGTLLLLAWFIALLLRALQEKQ